MTEQIEDHRCKYLHGQPSNLTVDQHFRLLLRLLRKGYPTEYPVRVRRITLPLQGPRAMQGMCYVANSDKPKAQRYFVILIRNSDTWTAQRDTLIHEWAHALTWFQLPDGKEHGDAFARKYGVLYREFIED